MVRRIVQIGVVGVALVTGVAACSGDDDDDGGSGGNPPDIGAGATVAGSFNGALTSGTIEATIANSFAALGITGTMSLANGSSLTLTGTFDTDTHAIALAGTNSSGSYSFTGTAVDGRVTGTWTGPSDSGPFSLINATGGGAEIYCGTFDIPQVATGTFELITTADYVAGIARDDQGNPPAFLEGTRSGDTVEFNAYDDGEVAAVGTGTVNGQSASGALYGPNGEDPGATWTGTLCN